MRFLDIKTLKKRRKIILLGEKKYRKQETVTHIYVLETNRKGLERDASKERKGCFLVKKVK